MVSLLFKWTKFGTIVLLLSMLFACSSRGGGSLFNTATVPRAAYKIADELDRQILMRYAKRGEHSASEREEIARACLKIMGTTPVNLNTLTQSCPLARQMTEEVSSALMGLGYRYQELRKGSYIRFDRATGELILTRNVSLLADKYGQGQAILAGTYVISDTHVRFNLSLIHTLSNETIAKASVSIAITPDLAPLLDESPIVGGSGKVLPNTYTHFR